MSFEKIKETILKDAKAEAEKIIKAAEEKAEAVLKKGKLKIDREIEETFLKEKDKIDSRIRGEKGEVLSTATNEVLALKNSILHKIFDEAQKLILKDKKRYHTWIENSLDSLSIEDKEKVELICRKADKAFIEKLVKSKKLNVKIKISEELGGGGFRISGKKWDFDFTVESKLENMKEYHRPEIARKIFNYEVK